MTTPHPDFFACEYKKLLAEFETHYPSEVVDALKFVGLHAAATALGMCGPTLVCPQVDAQTGETCGYIIGINSRRIDSKKTAALRRLLAAIAREHPDGPQVFTFSPDEPG